ncbi:MAG: transcription antitermination factor NusB [Patescibacteria group bacterium]
MKTQQDPRHQRRIAIMQALYSIMYQPTLPPELEQDVLTEVEEIVRRKTEINAAIDSYATSFTTEKMSRIDLAILQLGVYELLFDKKEPFRVVIDEAIELAKEFGSSNSQKFVNGILGHLIVKDPINHD